MSAGIGFGGAYTGQYTTKSGNGLGPKTQIVALTKTAGGALSQANLDDFVRAVTTQGGNPVGSPLSGVAGLNAFTVAAISAFTAGTTETVYLALQGTGTFVTDATDVYGVTGLTGTLVATFDQNPA